MEPVKTASKDIQNRHGVIALMQATFMNEKDVVQVLLENGTRVDFGEYDGTTALHYAAETGGK